MKQEKHVLLFS